MQDALISIKDGGVPPPALMPSFQEIKDTLGFNRYYKEEKQYQLVSYDIHFPYSLYNEHYVTRKKKKMNIMLARSFLITFLFFLVGRLKVQSQLQSHKSTWINSLAIVNSIRWIYCCQGAHGFSTICKVDSLSGRLLYFILLVFSLVALLWFE